VGSLHRVGVLDVARRVTLAPQGLALDTHVQARASIVVCTKAHAHRVGLPVGCEGGTSLGIRITPTSVPSDHARRSPRTCTGPTPRFQLIPAPERAQGQPPLLLLTAHRHKGVAEIAENGRVEAGCWGTATQQRTGGAPSVEVAMPMQPEDSDGACGPPARPLYHIIHRCSLSPKKHRT
jgi:hypothetical protein